MLQQFSRLVVVAGCQRSGTTLTGQLLGAHPRCLLLDETDGFYRWADSLLDGTGGDDAQLGQVLELARRKYRSATGRWGQDGPGDVAGAPRATHLVLQAPNLTHRFADLARLQFPLSVVFLVRDPRAVVASMTRLTQVPMTRNQANYFASVPALRGEFRSDLARLVDEGLPMHVRRAILWRMKSGLCPRFTEAGIPTLVLHYEDLVAGLEGSCRAMARHAGLDSDPLMLRHHEVYRGHGPGGTDRGRAVDADSVRDWEDTLTPEQLEDVLCEAGEVARLLGYPRRQPAARPHPGR